jgi:hypothetical protein
MLVSALDVPTARAVLLGCPFALPFRAVGRTAIPAELPPALLHAPPPILPTNARDDPVSMPRWWFQPEGTCNSKPEVTPSAQGVDEYGSADMARIFAPAEQSIAAG